MRTCVGLLLSSLLFLMAAAPPAAAQSAPASASWLPGPAAVGDASSLAGFIDAPRPGAAVAGTSLQVAGWFVDQTAQGWAGADDVELFLGSMDSGRPLAHASVAQNRPDVAAALHNPFWAAAGWSGSIPLSALPSGTQTISVYVHTPAKGWWLKQVSVTVPPQPAPPAPPPPPPTLGFDISSPQCATGAEPANPAFGIVGVNGGTAFSSNPCLARQYVWALGSTSPSQPHVAFYANTGNPGPDASHHWPTGATAPRACDGTWSSDCAYDYGWLALQDAWARAAEVAGTPVVARSTWWLDVEASNSWSPDPNVNAAALEGALAFLRSAGAPSVGIYTTSADWSSIIGGAADTSAFAALPNWQPVIPPATQPADWCSRTITGGRVKYVQFQAAPTPFDADWACF